MNRFLIAIVVILVIAAGIYFYTSQQSSAPTSQETTTSETSSETTTPETPTETSTSTETETSTPTEESSASTTTAEAGVEETQLTVSQIQVWPREKMVSVTGVAVFAVTVINETDSAVTEDVTLQADGQILGSPKSVSLEPGQSATVTFEIRGFSAQGSGQHTFTVADQSVNLMMIEPVSMGEQNREIPPNPKVLGLNYGLMETGIPGGKMVVATNNGPKTLNALLADETSSTNITTLLQSGLVETNPVTFDIEPALATHWEFSEDSKTVTFFLRQGVRFSDGHPFTADDVVFTFNDLIFNDDISTDARDGLKVKGDPVNVEKVDEYTVTVTTAEPFRPLMRQMVTSIYPKHKLADRVAKLNPGVRGVMRGIKTTLDSFRETLEGLDAGATAALEQSLSDLDAAIDVKDAEQVDVVAGAIQTALATLNGLLTEDDASLQTEIERGLAQIDLIGTYVAEDKWEGVPPGTFNNTWTADTPAADFAGLGRFKFVRYDVDQQVILERNPYYWKVDANGVQLPYLDQLVFLVVENTDVAFLKFKTGETDIFGARPEDWPLLLENVSEDDCQTRDDGKIICIDDVNDWELLRGGPLFGTTFLIINQDAEDPLLRAVFRSLKFRKAVAHTMDKQSMIDNIFNGLAVPQWSPVSVPSPYYDDTESFTTYPFDLEQAEQLLDETGLVDTDGDGIRNITDQFLESVAFDLSSLSDEKADENNRELEFLTITVSGSTLFEKISNLIVSDLNKVGLKVTFKPMDFNALVTDLTGAKYETVVIGLTGGVEPHSGSNVWKSDGGLHAWRYSAKDNPTEWEKRVDELFDLAATTFDEAKVKAYYREYQQLVSENLPLIYTVNNQFIYASKAAFGNNDNFQPITGNFPASLAFSEVLWWRDETRRGLVEDVEPQG